jgi:hypothetical protein
MGGAGTGSWIAGVDSDEGCAGVAVCSSPRRPAGAAGPVCTTPVPATVDAPGTEATKADARGLDADAADEPEAFTPTADVDAVIAAPTRAASDIRGGGLDRDCGALPPPAGKAGKVCVTGTA